MRFSSGHCATFSLHVSIHQIEHFPTSSIQTAIVDYDCPIEFRLVQCDQEGPRRSSGFQQGCLINTGALRFGQASACRMVRAEGFWRQASSQHQPTPCDGCHNEI